MPDSSNSLQALIEAVNAADSATRLTDAVQQLADARLLSAIPTLIAALGYNNPGAAVAAVEGLIVLGEPAVPALLNELDQHNYTARAWAIRSLAGIGDPRGLTTLLGAATADFAMSVRRAAARGLGKLRWAEFPRLRARNRPGGGARRAAVRLRRRRMDCSLRCCDWTRSAGASDLAAAS